MLKKYFLFLLAMASVIQGSMAQTKTAEQRIFLRSISNIGLLNGSKGSSVSLQTLLGAAFKGTFAGVGVGIDYYRFRSIPLFFDLRHEFGKGRRNFFVYGDLGYNFDWLTEKNKEIYYFSSTSKYKGGIYYDAGIGYKISFKNKDALLISTGYSMKRIKNEVNSPFCPIAGPCSQETETYLYSMQRLVIKAGWSF